MALSRENIIPLFPLQRVLFPKMILPLHIFEDRYKKMIRLCLKRDRDFGILTHDNLDTGAVGCSASVHHVVKEYDDGSMDILALGKQRFRLKRLIMGKPYLEGVILPFDDDPNAANTPAAKIDELLTLYRRYISRLGLEDQQREDLENLIEEIKVEKELSYIIGQTIGLDTSNQQDLLAENSGAGRVHRLLAELRKQNVVHNLAADLFENSDFDPKLN